MIDPCSISDVLIFKTIRQDNIYILGFPLYPYDDLSVIHVFVVFYHSGAYQEFSCRYLLATSYLLLSSTVFLDILDTKPLTYKKPVFHIDHLDRTCPNLYTLNVPYIRENDQAQLG
jgi:hypothetical protein